MSDEPRHDWSAETIAKLRALWAEGHSTAEIGRRLHVSKNAIVGKAHRLGLPQRPSPIKRGGPDPAVPPKPSVRVRPPRLADISVRQEPEAAEPEPEALTPEAPAPEPVAAPAAPEPPPVAAPIAPPLAPPITPPLAVAAPVLVPARPVWRHQVAVLERFGHACGGPGQCRWPFGDPQAADFRFCAEPAEFERPYCAEHWQDAHQPGIERRWVGLVGNVAWGRAAA